MSNRRRVAVRVAAHDVPDGLVALHIENVRVGPDGRAKVRGPGPGGIRRLVLAADEATRRLVQPLTHGAARELLASATRRRSVLDELASDEAALALARAGLVRLQVPATQNGDGVSAGRWASWERTREGASWADAYGAFDLADPLVAHAVRGADDRVDGDAASWAATVEEELARVRDICDHATALVDDGAAHGWTAAAFAEAVTGDPEGLAPDAPLTDIVLGHLARHLGSSTTPGTDAERAALLATAGIGAAPLAATVASIRLPGGGGAAGALLSAAAAHDVPLLLQRALVAEDGGRHVAPPRSVGWVFAVQDDETFTAATELPVRTPVVLHGGSPAALPLLRQATRAGWRVVVSTDDDEVGRRRRDWLLERLGDTAVAWRATDGPATGRREADEREALLAAITKGTPS